MRISSLSLFAVIAAALIGCAAENSEAPAEAHNESDLLSQRRQLEARVQRLPDRARRFLRTG